MKTMELEIILGQEKVACLSIISKLHPEPHKGTSKFRTSQHNPEITPNSESLARSVGARDKGIAMTCGEGFPGCS